MKTLKDLFLDTLADMLDAEHRLVNVLSKFAEITTCTRLQSVLLGHLKETEGHISKLEVVFEAFGEKAVSNTCDATKGLLEKGAEIAAEYTGSQAINAALICAAQQVEHHEIATYGCLLEWARLLNNNAAADILEEILAEEKAANASLTDLARIRGNPEAMGETDTLNTAPIAI